MMYIHVLVVAWARVPHGICWHSCDVMPEGRLEWHTVFTYDILLHGINLTDQQILKFRNILPMHQHSDIHVYSRHNYIPTMKISKP